LALASKPLMRRCRKALVIPLLAVSFCALSVHADDHGRQRKEARRQIERLESRFREAALKNDVATLDKMTAEDYIGIGPTGVLQTKQQLIASRVANKVRFQKIEYSDTKIRVYGDSAVVTTTAEIEGHSDANGDFNGKYRYTRVYSRHNEAGSWLIVSFEASKVKER
jgi:ketosteroid isomerase-like protein